MYDIEKTFTYHAPNEEQQKRYTEIRAKAKELAYVLQAACPDSREKSLAMTKLQETVMMANAAVAIHW